MTAYYNEIDPFAAAWLRQLISAGHIAPGDVDERSIVDVRPDDLRKYTQCHFFAGIGVWSYALRRAGWPDDRPIWTGSCPCPPFSAAGKGQTCPACGSKRNLCHPVKTGHFICLACGCDRFADARHLWPEFSRLIKVCSPSVVFGEQVASEDGRRWLDTVSADLQLASYGFAGADFCAAGVGSPNIRQRLYWVADADDEGLEGRIGTEERPSELTTGARGLVGKLADPDRDGREPWSERQPALGYGTTTESNGQFSRLADAELQQRSRSAPRYHEARGRDEKSAKTSGLHGFGGVADAPSDRWREQRADAIWSPERSTPEGLEQRSGGGGILSAPGPTNGLWRDADWLFCRDGKWRPVEPGTFPLAHGAPARVGRLRGCGNAINAEQATAFIKAYLETEADRCVRVEGAFA